MFERDELNRKLAYVERTLTVDLVELDELKQVV